MNLKKTSTALFVKDIEISKKFYVNILQQKIKFDFGKNVILQNGLAIWEIDKKHIIPATLGLSKISDKSFNRFEIYFETDNLNTVFNSLKKNNIHFVHEIHEEPWGQCTIRFFDPDNHLIEVGESMKQFVSKLYKQGMTVEQVSARTSVSVEEVIRLLKIKKNLI